MDIQKLKAKRNERRRHRVRRSISGTATMPRLSVYRSNLHIYAQLIDDEAQVTLVAASSNDKDATVEHGSNVKAATVVGAKINVEGPKGKLEFVHHPNIVVKLDAGVVTVTRPNDDRQNRALHGLTRALVNNMVVGVSDGYTKRLKITGVGYQATMKGKAVELTVGFANRVLLDRPKG